MTLNRGRFSFPPLALHRPRRFSLIILLGFALLAASPSAMKAESSDSENDVTSVVDRFHEALRAGDRETAQSILHPDVIVFEGGRAETTREEYEHHHLGADMEFSAATMRTVDDRQTHVRGDTAWILSQTTTKGEFRGRPVNSVGVETMVLGRQGETWLILPIHWSSRRSSPATE